jgi:hypothetical protein
MRHAIHHRPIRSFAPAFAVLAFALLSATPLRLPDPKVPTFKASLGGYATRAMAGAELRAEHAIIIGGIVLERNRHLAAGSAIGCTLGAGFGAAAATGIGFVTGGAGFAAIPAASALGCGVFGVAGAAVGSPLDDYQMDLADLEGNDAH